MSLKIFKPSFCSFIIMSSCIHNTIMLIFIRKITAVFTSIKCKLQNLHSRISAFFQHVPHTVCKESKIFCNYAQLFYLTVKRMEQIHSRSLFPFSIFCSFIAKWDCIIFIKATEMINSNNVIKLQTMCHTLYPPAIIIFLQFFPVIKRISP